MEDELNLDSAMDSIAADIQQQEQATPDPLEGSPPDDLGVEGSPAPTSTEEGDKVASSTTPVPTQAIKPIPNAPNTWRPEAAEEWNKLPERVREEILKREEDMFKGSEEYKAKMGQATPVMDVLKPYMPLLQQHNIDPAVMVRNLMQAQYTLATGNTQQKTAMLQRLAQSYGIEWGADAGMLDPQASVLEDRLNKLEGNWANNIRQQTMQEVEAFASRLDDAGKPLHPYFDEVADDIVGLIQAGQAADLQSAYEKAIWLNPVTRDKEVARLNSAAAEKAKRAAEEAKRAEAANVKTSAKAATAGSPKGSMDDTMRETLKAIQARA